MEEKFFLPIFLTLPKSNGWTREQFFKQLQHEYRDLRVLSITDFDKVWKLMEKADMVVTRKNILGITRKGRHISRLNYSHFTMKHFEFHQEHGTEYMVRFQGGNSDESKRFFENMLNMDIENLLIAVAFGVIVLSLSVWMGKGIMKTAFNPGFDKIEKELDQHLEQQLNQAIPKDLNR